MQCVSTAFGSCFIFYFYARDEKVSEKCVLQNITVGEMFGFWFGNFQYSFGQQ